MDQLSGGRSQLIRPALDPRSPWHRLVREPLVHFLLLGLLLFATYYWIVGGDRRAESRTIVIDDAVVGEIIRQHMSVWQRPPTPVEMRGLLETFIQDEVYYREGVAQGLLDGDPVIRRRIRQKMQVIAEESARTEPPTDDELRRWLREHPDRYAAPPTLSFAQLMFDPIKLGNRTEAAIADARQKLAAGADPAGLAEATLLPDQLADAPADRIARDFGEDFAAAIQRLPVGKWEGPVRSGYGLHLVRVTRRVPGRPLGLEEVRKAVERDWEADRRQRANASYFRELRDDYDVVVEAELPVAARPADK